MGERLKRPTTPEELEQLEADGFWKAIALSKAIGEGSEKITLQVILEIHRVIFSNAVPEEAGRFRISGEDIKKLKCIEPPVGRLVQEKMFVFARELDVRISKLHQSPKKYNPKKRNEWHERVFDLVAWVQHQIVAIHPFCNGNGRMGRLLTNLVLRRFGLPPSRVKYEGENKAEYLQALCQIDLYTDYKPLKRLIVKSVIETVQKELKERRKAQKLKQSH